MDTTEYVIEWAFANKVEALKAWWREIPKAYRVVDRPKVTEVEAGRYRVVGTYTVGD